MVWPKVIPLSGVHSFYKISYFTIQEIDDPNDSKPEDWDEREKIADPEAKKPEDWDESQPRQIQVTKMLKLS